MTAEQTRQVVTDLLAARDAGDADRVSELLAEDVVFIGPQSLMPEHRTGLEAVRTQLMTAAASTFETLTRTYHEIIADRGVAAVTQTAKGHTRDGIDYENDYVFVYHLRDGKVQQIIEHADSLRAARIFGRV
jgi:ketosteroid isomerase-like protein